MDRYRGNYNSPDISDQSLFVGAIIIPVVAYKTLSFILRSTQVPLLVSVFIGSNMISRSRFFRSLIGRSVQPREESKIIKAPSSSNQNYDNFTQLSESSKLELLSAIRSLQNYRVNAKKVNERRRKLFKSMSWRQQRLCEDVGYLNKLKKIDQSIVSNQSLANAIADQSISDFGITYNDFKLLSANESNASSNNYRVIESMGHFIRDWKDADSEELEPMLRYIIGQLNDIIPPESRSKTCIIIPGSGLGRVAHEISQVGAGSSNAFHSVYAVEYSGLMHICNRYIYSEEAKSHKIYPYVHSCSNFYETKSQFRSTDIKTGLEKQQNLHLVHDDFRYFDIPNKHELDSVVVISAFFVDTAENLIEYFDKIQSLTIKSKNGPQKGFWINVGPLKYGSAAQVELTAEEISGVRQKMGWVDIDVTNSLNSESSLNNGLTGYITDKQSMWQGYYGLSMWTSKRKENSR